MPSLRLLSVDARAFGRDRGALTRTISAAGVDVACVHGAPHLLRWRSRVARVARESGLVVAAGGRPAGANVVLCTLGVDLVAGREVRLGPPRGRAPELRGPGAALAALRLRGEPFVAVGATLIGNAADRLDQATQLQAAIDALVPDRPPVIISAQGSDRPGSAAWQTLVEDRVGVAGRIFIDGRIAVGEADEIERGAIVAELSF